MHHASHHHQNGIKYLFIVSNSQMRAHTHSRAGQTFAKTLPFQRRQGATEHRTNPMVSLSSDADDSTHRSLIFIKSRFKFFFFLAFVILSAIHHFGLWNLLRFYISCGSVQSGVFCFTCVVLIVLFIIISSK